MAGSQVPSLDEVLPPSLKWSPSDMTGGYHGSLLTRNKGRMYLGVSNRNHGLLEGTDADTIRYPGDRPRPAITTGRVGSWPLVVIASAHLMAILDTTVMFVALPSIQQGLGMTVATRQWVVTAYTVALAGLLLPGGRLADRFGARRTLLVGVIGYACASAVGGASVNGAMLIAARAVQGAFGAVLVSSTKSLLISVYRDETERARVIGVFTATLTAGAALGLVLGGVVTSGLGWRWCLYLNVGLSLVPIVGAPRVLPALPPRPAVRIDVLSVLLASLGMVALVYGLGEAAAQGWSSGQIIGSLVAAVALLSGFAARQGGTPRTAAADPGRAGPQPRLAMVALIVNALSTVGMMLILTYQLQSVMHYAALETGIALIPFAATAAIGSAVVAPWLMVRVPPRWLIAGSVVIEAAGLVPLIWLTPTSHYLPLILVATVIEGLGTGVAGPTTLNTALGGALPSDTGAAGAGTSAASQLALDRRGPAQHHRHQRHRQLPRNPPAGERRQRDSSWLCRRHGMGRTLPARCRHSHRPLRGREGATVAEPGGLSAGSGHCLVQRCTGGFR